MTATIQGINVATVVQTEVSPAMSAFQGLRVGAAQTGEAKSPRVVRQVSQRAGGAGSAYVSACCVHACKRLSGSACVP